MILHHIRIELKKIKALIHLFDHCFKKFSGPVEYRLLKEVFQAAGKIREVTVFNRLLNKYKIKLRKENKSIANENLIYDFRKNIFRYKKIIVRSHSSILKYADKLDTDCFKKYLKLKKDELLKRIYPDLTESELHKIRKIVKEIIYLSSISLRNKKARILSTGNSKILSGAGMTSRCF